MAPDEFENGFRISEAPEAIGDFYTLPHECINCGDPAAMAPDLLAHHREHGHCYFIKQPSDASEVRQLISAIDASCVGNIYYRGADPEMRNHSLATLRKSFFHQKRPSPHHYA
jgi:4Fe-4S single cluster domain of Ferredoxin I